MFGKKSDDDLLIGSSEPQEPQLAPYKVYVVKRRGEPSQHEPTIVVETVEAHAMYTDTGILCFANGQLNGSQLTLRIIHTYKEYLEAYEMAEGVVRH